MARWNKKRRVLDHEHSKFWRHNLVEVVEPNLMREIFPYDEVPPHRLRPPPDAHRSGGRYLHHRHHVPGRPASPPPLFGETDRDHFRLPAPAFRPRRSHPPHRIFPLHREGPRSPGTVPFARLQVSRHHRVDPRRRRRPPARKGRGAFGNRHPHVRIRLPYLPQAEDGPEGRHAKVSEGRDGGTRKGHRAQVPFRRPDAGGHLRLLHPLCDGNSCGCGKRAAST